MTAAEGIALAAVIATGLSAVVTVAANAWLANRRLDHEKVLHKERLAHERAESVRSIAASAYSKADLGTTE